MKASRLLIYLCVMSCLPQPLFAQGISGKALRGIVTVLTGAGAAKAFQEMSVARLDYNERKAALETLRQQGCYITESAVYSLSFSLNGDVSSVRWADWFSNPDVFAVVSIEGEGSFLVPDIRYEYSGGPILLTFVAHHARRGQKIVVSIYDDDTSGNEIWNSILQSRINYNVSTDLQALAGIPIAASVGGKFQLSNRYLVIDAHDHIASAEFHAPYISFEDDWVAHSRLVDSSGREVGTLRLARILDSDLSPAEATKAAYGRFVFWAVVGVCCSVAFLRFLFWRDRTKITQGA